MDKIKDKLNSLRAEADNAVARAEEAETKTKKYEQQLLERDQEITSLTHRNAVLEEELEKAEGKVNELKAANQEGEGARTTNEGLNRKIQLLEEELDAAEKNVKETMEKLRQVDVKAEHFERQVHVLEQERDQWEKKFEDMQEKYKKSKGELDELVSSMEGL
ncbi:actin filament-coating protein tropomyosin [Coniophora puteana RWD-64-598 SS2]|uniref:Actin filament-coating protein tropomyosin n=1 Tax=Coniophora puteana (strain RWD-64-598) TaxID=741705 RepID=A0A5M3MJD0_CONPW|nr:actin filament-coating protein tropomyosin [Coniophora puteana RWD-64-598 SS2]EIW79156.1 actin filament-coating protein tropomyosin [Coniophora puteana RWD-64-598 SS2]